MFDQTGVPEYNLASSCDSYSARSFFFSHFFYITYTWGAVPGFCIRKIGVAMYDVSY